MGSRLRVVEVDGWWFGILCMEVHEATCRYLVFVSKPTSLGRAIHALLYHGHHCVRTHGRRVEYHLITPCLSFSMALSMIYT